MSIVTAVAFWVDQLNMDEPANPIVDGFAVNDMTTGPGMLETRIRLNEKLSLWVPVRFSPTPVPDSDDPEKVPESKWSRNVAVRLLPFTVPENPPVTSFGPI